MKSWMEERDLLIAQTMAFVEEVAASTPVRREPIVAATSTPVEAQIAAAPRDNVQNAERPMEVEPRLAEAPPQPIGRLALLSAVDERTEILNRVASFKAHQARFFQDRDRFFRAMMTNIGDPAGSAGRDRST